MRKARSYKQKNMSESEFNDFCRTEHIKYQKEIKYSDDSIPYYEFYIEMCLYYQRPIPTR